MDIPGTETREQPEDVLTSHLIADLEGFEFEVAGASEDEMDVWRLDNIEVAS